MAHIVIPKPFYLDDKVALMEEDASYEIAGDRDAETCALNASHTVKAKKQPPKVPKSFLASSCIFNCAYCNCRCTREDRENYCFSPRELANLSVSRAYQEGHGVFVTSAIHKNADYTQELLAETVRIMRQELHYRGYIHAKVMPGVDPQLIKRTGRYADRLSVNIEVAKSEGYARIAKQKNKKNILEPMKTISDMIQLSKYEKGAFARSQSTQLMAGSVGEDDRTIVNLAHALYNKYKLKRVYYTAFQYKQQARGYGEMPPVSTPYWRMARLYQADRLMELYGFLPSEITPESRPNLIYDLDPKSCWALEHLDRYPVEVNKADFHTLIRIPGIGVTYAQKIIEARKYCTITHEVLRKMKVALKRSVYFITCNGIYMGGNTLDGLNLRSHLVTDPDGLSISGSLLESPAVKYPAQESPVSENAILESPYPVQLSMDQCLYH